MERGEVDVDIWEELTVEKAMFWLVIGDWHLEPLGDKTGEVTGWLEMPVEC